MVKSQLPLVESKIQAAALYTGFNNPAHNDAAGFLLDYYRPVLTPDKTSEQSSEEAEAVRLKREEERAFYVDDQLVFLNNLPAKVEYHHERAQAGIAGEEPLDAWLNWTGSTAKIPPPLVRKGSRAYEALDYVCNTEPVVWNAVRLRWRKSEQNHLHPEDQLSWERHQAPKIRELYGDARSMAAQAKHRPIFEAGNDDAARKKRRAWLEERWVLKFLDTQFFKVIESIDRQLALDISQ